MSTKRIRFILLLVLAVVPVILIITAAVFEFGNTLSVLPSEKYNAIGWWPTASESTSVNVFKYSSRKIELEYTLDGSPAFAGFGIILDQNYPFLDLSKYAEVTVRITTSKAAHFGVIIMTFEKGITQFINGSYNPLRYCQTRTEIPKKSGTYSIKLADLKDPDWWIARNAPRGKALDRNPLKESALLQFFFDESDLIGQKDRIEVNEITFHSISGFLRIMLVIGTICYYIIYGIILFFPGLQRKIEDNRIKLLTSYKRIEDLSCRQQDAEIVCSYITERYYNPDISLEGVSAETGIPQKRITDVVRKEYGMTFKECINWLRIQEAKRLLSETDLNITIIAFRLGFNTNSYFGSIFKSYEGFSPKEYRKKYGSVK